MNNGYVALLEHAHRGGWYVRMDCTTCGGTDLRVGLKLLSMGIHPDTWTRLFASSEGGQSVQCSYRGLTDDERQRLAIVLKEADPFEIVRRPAWKTCCAMVSNALRPQLEEEVGRLCSKRLQDELRSGAGTVAGDGGPALHETRLGRSDDPWDALCAAAAILRGEPGV